MSIDEFGSILKELRTKVGLNQDDIAKELAISRQSISKWELGISLPDITYLVPLTKILKCELEDLLNLKRKDADNMKDIFKVIIRKNIDRKEYEVLKSLYGERWLDRSIDFINLFYYNENFFILGSLDNKIASALHITKHPEQNDFYLISDLAMLEEHKSNDLASSMVDTALAILKDLNCIKVGAFVEKEYKDVFEKFGFIKVSDDYEFGNDKKCTSCADPYFELMIEQDYYCEEINEENANIVSKVIMKKKYKYCKEVANYFKPNAYMFQQNLLRDNKFDNEKVYVIMNGKTVCGYTKMFNEEDKNLYLRIDLREECLYDDAVKVAVEQAKEYANKVKDKAEIDFIVFYVNDSLLLKEEFDFYRKALINNGFETNDDIKFVYKLN